MLTLWIMRSRQSVAEVGYILSFLFRFFVRLKVLQPTDCISLTSHCLAWIWDILFSSANAKWHITKWWLISMEIVSEHFYGVRSTERSVLSEFHSFSSWSCTWTYFLQQALKGQRHNHMVKLLQELHPISVYYSLCSWGTQYVLFLAGFTLICALTFHSYSLMHVRGRHLIMSPLFNS